MQTDVSSVAAESSPAAVEVPTGSADYAEWRMSGKLPEAKPAATPKPAAAAAAKTETSGASEEGAEHASASEAESQQEKKPRTSPSGAPARSNAETRLNELLADLKRAGMSPAELKTFRREAQAQPKAATEQTAKPAEAAQSEAPKKPDQSRFDTWDKYEAALDKYHEDLAEHKAQKAIADYQGRQQQEAFQRELQTKFTEAKVRYGDTAEATIVSTAQQLAGDAQIHPTVKSMIDASPVLTDLLYVMGSKPEDLSAFVELARTNPAGAIRRLVVVEGLVTAELAKGAKPAAAETPERDESGKFTPPAKKITQAPPPPREASGRAAPPADEVEAAVQANDFTRFRAAQNRRDIQRRRGA